MIKTVPDGKGNEIAPPFDIEFKNILNKEQDSASCSILRVGDIKIMLDCGCDEKIDNNSDTDPASSIRRVEAAAREVDYIFISHATIQQVGTLPFLHKRGILSNLQGILSTSPVAKVGAQTMYEFAIQKKELSDFCAYSLQDVEGAFCNLQLVSFNENKRLKIKDSDTEVIVSAIPSGNSIGGTAWKIEFQKQTIVYGLELNDKSTQLTPPMHLDNFKNVNILITNGYLQNYSVFEPSYGEGGFTEESKLGPVDTGNGKIAQFVSEERLKVKVEQAILETHSQLMIPCSSKNKILALLLAFENLFQNNQKLQQAATKAKPLEVDLTALAGTSNLANPPITQQSSIEPIVIYLEHMSKETIDVAKSHTSWMNFKDNSQNEFDKNPFNFQYVKSITSIEEFRKMAYTDSSRLKPLVIITSVASLNQGYSKQILREFTARDQNEIVFVER